MKWFRCFSDRILSPEYTMLEDHIVAAHVRLLARCAKDDNEGRFASSGAWSDTEWVIRSGLRKSQIQALVRRGLAKWEPTRQTTLAGIEPGSKPSGSNVVGCVIGGTPTPMTHPATFDLVVADFDHQGQNDYLESVRKGISGAAIRWGTPVQQPLNFNAPRMGSKCVDPVDPSIRPYADLRSEILGDPPQIPPPGGGGGERASRFRERRKPVPTTPEWEAFWEWLGSAIPRPLNRADKWLADRLGAFRHAQRAAEGTGEPLGTFLERVKRDLTAKFSDPRWVREIAPSATSIRSYLYNGDWGSPLPVFQVAAPEPVNLGRPDPDGFVKGQWAESFPDQPWPGRAEAERILKGIN